MQKFYLPVATEKEQYFFAALFPSLKILEGKTACVNENPVGAVPIKVPTEKKCFKSVASDEKERIYNIYVSKADVLTASDGYI